jgi:hypothetical protein
LVLVYDSEGIRHQPVQHESDQHYIEYDLCAIISCSGETWCPAPKKCFAVRGSAFSLARRIELQAESGLRYGQHGRRYGQSPSQAKISGKLKTKQRALSRDFESHPKQGFKHGRESYFAALPLAKCSLQSELRFWEKFSLNQMPNWTISGKLAVLLTPLWSANGRAESMQATMRSGQRRGRNDLMQAVARFSEESALTSRVRFSAQELGLLLDCFVCVLNSHRRISEARVRGERNDF